MSTPIEGKPIEVSMIEDNEGDARLARETLRECKIKNTLHHARDGGERMAFLRRVGRFADAPCPDLVLLDLNLPGKSGQEVLAEIKADPDLRRIPVVIRTVSSDKADVLKSYDLHANCFITKPIDLMQFITVIKSIEDFWLTIVRLPDGAECSPARGEVGWETRAFTFC
jgi:two-component system, chemotaxis family, response regulator Rcp1